MKLLKRLTLSLFLGLMLAPGVVQAQINVTSWNLFATAREAKSSLFTEVENVVTLPIFGTTSTATASGGTTAQSQYNFSVVGDTASFRIDTAHNVTAAFSSSGASTGQLGAVDPTRINFTTTNPVKYSFEGQNAKTSGPQVLVLDIILKEANAAFSDPVFRSHLQGFRNIPQGTFVVGQLGASEVNVLQGSISGVLPPGSYVVYIGIGIEGSLAHQAVGAATGFVELNLTPICSCASFTATAFEPPMGKKKQIGSMLPFKFRLFFDGLEVVSETQLNQILQDSGCMPGCPKLLIFEEPVMGLLLDDVNENVGNPDEGDCFRYSAPNWVYNVRLAESTFMPHRCYSVEIEVGDCIIVPDNNFFETK